MKVIITGGTGLIGKKLTAELLSAGHEIIILSRSPEKARDLPQGVQVAGWDARTGQGWVHLVEEAPQYLVRLGTDFHLIPDIFHQIVAHCDIDGNSVAPIPNKVWVK